MAVFGVFTSIMDMVRCGVCDPMELNCNALLGTKSKKSDKKGILELIVFKDSVRTYFTLNWLGSLKLPEDNKAAIRKVFECHESYHSMLSGYPDKAGDSRSLAWKADWPTLWGDLIIKLLEGLI